MKMNLFFAICFLTFCPVIFAQNSKHHFEFGNLCNERIYVDSYNNSFTFNSFYELKKEIGSLPMCQLLLYTPNFDYRGSESCLENRFPIKGFKKMIETFFYNLTVSKLSERVDFAKNQIKILKNNELDKFHLNQTNYYLKFDELIQNFTMFLNILDSFKDDYLSKIELSPSSLCVLINTMNQTNEPVRFRPFSYDEINLKRVMISNNPPTKPLTRNTDDIFIFKNENFDAYYEKRIFSLKDIHLERESDYFFSLYSSLFIKYSLYIPVFRKNLEIFKENCTNVKQLPKFFTDDTKPV